MLDPTTLTQENAGINDHSFNKMILPPAGRRCDQEFPTEYPWAKKKENPKNPKNISSGEAKNVESKKIDSRKNNTGPNHDTSGIYVKISYHDFI